MRGSQYFLIAIMVIMLLIIGVSLGIEFFASKLLPIVFSSIGIVLAAIQLARENKEKPTTAKSGTEVDISKKTRDEWRGYLRNGVWLGGFVLGIYFLGIITALPLFILSYMKWLGSRWRVAIPFAIVTTTFIYVVFQLVLELYFYQGLLLSWLGY